MGHIISGKLTVHMNDGTTQTVGAGSSYTISPGHEAWVEGDKTFFGIEVTSAEQYTQPKRLI